MESLVSRKSEKRIPPQMTYQICLLTDVKIKYCLCKNVISVNDFISLVFNVTTFFHASTIIYTLAS